MALIIATSMITAAGQDVFLAKMTDSKDVSDLVTGEAFESNETGNMLMESKLGAGAGCKYVGTAASDKSDCFAKRSNQGFGQACYGSGHCVLASSCAWVKSNGFKCCFGSYNDESCNWHSFKTKMTAPEQLNSTVDHSGDHIESDGPLGASTQVTDDTGAFESNDSGIALMESKLGAGAGCSYAGTAASDKSDCFAKRSAQGFGQACYGSGHCVLASSCAWVKSNGFKCCFGSYNDESCDWHSGALARINHR